MLANQWVEEAIARERRSDMMRQAEHERSVRRMTAGRSPSMGRVRRAIGNRLILAGQRLQAQPQPQPPALRNAHEW